MRFFKNPTYKFMSVRKPAFLFSGILILISIISLILHGGPKYSVDFRGGTFMEIRFEDKENPEKPIAIEIGRLRGIFEDFGMQNAEIKHYGSMQEISVRADITENTDVIFHNLIDRLSKEYPDYNVIEMRKETVGPKVGKELVGAAILAILWATVFILLYIMWRFELRFGIGAVAATMHDVIVTIGIFSVLNIEISIAIVAALLTIVGYSLNDTIVVFDRIRENLKSLRRQAFDYPATINRSINETLSRTIVTSGTTLLVVAVLYFFGGEVLKDFSFALICGIIVGTYSSMFIASPILVEFERRKKVA
ncbi:MAG: protein translocase subunit SecF [Calditrichaeota bacterium]|nr:protein translocase subunit SecF [Calditrichota bacterium]RQW03028.1 MAG: protein translocase subunit SecF [Calditrichota bacterium]